MLTCKSFDCRTAARTGNQRAQQVTHRHDTPVATRIILHTAEPVHQARNLQLQRNDIDNRYEPYLRLTTHSRLHTRASYPILLAIHRVAGRAAPRRASFLIHKADLHSPFFECIDTKLSVQSRESQPRRIERSACQPKILYHMKTRSVCVLRDRHIGHSDVPSLNTASAHGPQTQRWPHGTNRWERGASKQTTH